MNCRHHPVCRSRSCAELGHNNNLNPVGKPARPPSIELAFPCIEEDVSPIRPPAGVCALEGKLCLFAFFGFPERPDQCLLWS